MTSTTDVKISLSLKCAVCHIDGTARPQIVDKKATGFSMI